MKYRKDIILILYDLWWLRYKSNNTWYELTDYLRDKLVEDGIQISYDDKNKDLIFNHQSLKKLLKKV